MTTQPLGKILVIDDNEDLADVFSELLRTMSYDARIAVSGRLGLALVPVFRPQVIFCDLEMPGMSGYDVAKEIKSNKEFDHPLLISMSGFNDPETIKRSSEAGFDIHAAKPISIAFISALLSDYFGPM